MNEVEKLYRTAKVMPSHHHCNDCQYKVSAECPIRCPDNVAVYPPFTAEKQLELIKWLAKFDDFYVLKDFEFDKYRSLCGLVASEYIDTFEEMLANLILNIWDELTKAQKKQIKEILE